MSKRQVILDESPEITDAAEIPEEMTPEEAEEVEREEAEKREKALAPYRAVHQQQNEQDELLAELLFKDTMRDLEMEV